MAKRVTVTSLVEELVAAADLCALKAGNANWTDGYRAGNERELRKAPTEEKRMEDKSLAQWKMVDEAYTEFRKTANRIVRKLRRRRAGDPIG